MSSSSSSSDDITQEDVALAWKSAAAQPIVMDEFLFLDRRDVKAKIQQIDDKYNRVSDSTVNRYLYTISAELHGLHTFSNVYLCPQINMFLQAEAKKDEACYIEDLHAVRRKDCNVEENEFSQILNYGTGKFNVVANAIQTMAMKEYNRSLAEVSAA